MSCKGKGKSVFMLLLAGAVLGFSLMIAFNWFWVNSSTNESCMACHAHPASDAGNGIPALVKGRSR